MNNRDFCYWLQGYFEITPHPSLTADKLMLIASQLKLIDEPLGQFTGWLQQLVVYLLDQQNNQALLDYFLTVIKDELNLIFYHVIDPIYDDTIGRAEAIKIHFGLQNE